MNKIERHFMLGWFVAALAVITLHVFKLCPFCQ